MMKNWDQADRISDAIVRLVNKELASPPLDPMQILVGILLGLTAFLKTAPPGNPTMEALKAIALVALARIDREVYPPEDQSLSSPPTN